ncbi:methyltransferase domain-containing protein [Gracilibacillus caseinilyticus]|uniref:Methyltransferase domain-containing protein n=1 Tax=Gracilibacillus caseinilyticus TaxID=2932256 RepID=A0ABY4EZJ5_9BACI|nr:methyltransferase domain-containing protein [Gracilibacillus caseinilyticus]UOQ49278.1 methyltransferase domain-containing protein [Gracilibacillus caseinilyticus]
MKKIERAAHLIGKHRSLFQCPICKEAVTIKDTSVICTSNHQFDLAKKGYVNFFSKASPKDYDKQLFEARYQVIQSGMYDLLHQKIVNILTSGADKSTNMLDVGCGEGSHLQQIQQRSDRDLVAVGIDIAKDGILTAAKYHPDMIWAVADLAQSPFQGGKFDIILNILSPANYQEFKRLLADNGMLIKVIPRADYLKEIREQVMQQDSQHYSNTEVINNCRKQFDHIQVETIQYTWEVPSDLHTALWNMTPLTWGKKMKKSYQSITIDFDIIIAKA